MKAPDWLPDLIEFDWNRYQESIERAYSVYLRDFEKDQDRPRFRLKRMGLKRHPPFDGKDATFWHFVTKGRIEETRAPERPRIERIAWPKALLVEANAPSARVLVWLQARAGERRWAIALQDFSYLVIVDERDDYVLPWTAYPVEEAHERGKLKKAYEQYEKEKKAGAASR